MSELKHLPHIIPPHEEIKQIQKREGILTDTL